MELNEEDSNKRRFVLVTNNENDIATDICRERIYRIINGIGSKRESIK
jgi:adenine-specific DNA-methyltransferase